MTDKKLEEDIFIIVTTWPLFYESDTAWITSDEFMKTLSAISDSPLQLKLFLYEQDIVEINEHGLWNLTEKSKEVRLGKRYKKDKTLPKEGTSAQNWISFKNLLDYYISFVENETRDQYYLSPERYGKAFSLPDFHTQGWLQSLEESDKNPKKICLQFKQMEYPVYDLLLSDTVEDKEICLGYPLLAVVNWDRTPRYYIPLTTIPVTVNREAKSAKAYRARSAEIVLNFKEARLNQEWIDRCIDQEVQGSFVEMVETLHAGDEYDGLVDVASVLPSMLAYDRNAGSFQFDPDNLDQSLAIDPKSRRSYVLKNTAILFKAEDSTYSKNLLRELKAIKNAEPEVLDSTSLAYIYREPPLPTERTNRNPIPFIKSNYEQLDGTENAINESISRLQGPPGTGKSQVAVNIIANCIYYGDSVLFTSRNHSAINAIRQRSNSFISDHLKLVSFHADGEERVRWTEEDVDSVSYGLREITAKDVSVFQVEQALKSNKEATDEYLELEESRERLAEVSSKVYYAEKEYSGDISFFCGEEDAEKFDIGLFEKRTSAFMKSRAGGIKQFWFVLAHRKKYRNKIFEQIRTCYPNMPLNDISEFRKITDRISARKAAYEEACMNYDTAASHYDEKRCDAQEAEISMRIKLAEEQISQNSQEALIYLWQSRSLDKIDEVKNNIAEYKNDIANRRYAAKTNVASFVPDIRAQKNLHDVVPAWSTTLLSLGYVAPLAPGVFDQVIIDEASQCDPVSIIPALFRAKRATLIGDPQQFNPIVSMSKRKNDRIWRAVFGNNNKLARYSAYENSAYDILPTDSPHVMLKEHFRCNDDIATFISRAFYGGQLRIRTNEYPINFPEAFKDEGSSVIWRSVTNSRKGEIEQAWLIYKQLSDSAYDGSIGIISPLRSVVTDIQNRFKEEGIPFHENLADDDEIKLVISTSYSFQGRECDVVIFVIGYNDSLKRGQEWYITGSKNLNVYNVSLSRAKACLFLVGDREAVEKLNNHFFSALAKAGERKDTQLDFESKWEEKLYDSLKAAGINVDTQKPVLGYRLDMAYVDENIMIDIEVDGATYHLNPDGSRVARDRKRDLVLKNKGWIVKRFMVARINKDVDACVDEIRAEISGAKAKATQRRTESPEKGF